MDVLVLLVFEFEGNDRQAVKEENEINLCVGLAIIKMRTEG